MIDVVYLQMDSRNFYKELLRKGVAGRQVSEGSWGSVSKDPTETDRISSGVSKVEGKIKSHKGTDLKGLSVTQRIMNAHRKDKKEGYETFEEGKGHMFGGIPSGILF